MLPSISSTSGAQQRPFVIRALYFLLVGWWASALWLSVAWGLMSVTLGLGLPLAFWMFNRASGDDARTLIRQRAAQQPVATTTTLQIDRQCPP